MSVQGLKYRYTRTGDPLGLPAVLLSCCPEEIHRYANRICSILSDYRDIILFYEDPNNHISATGLRYAMSEFQLVAVAVTEKYLEWRPQMMKRIARMASSRGIPVLPLRMEDVPEDQVQALFRDIRCEGIFDPKDHAKLEEYLGRVLDEKRQARRIREVFDSYVYLCLRDKDPEYAETVWPLMQDNPFYIRYLAWFHIRRQKDETLMWSDFETAGVMTEGARQIYAVTFTEMTEKDHDRILAAALRDVKQEPVHAFLTGIAFLYGYGVEKDRDEGIRRLRQAADEGLKEAGKKLLSL